MATMEPDRTYQILDGPSKLDLMLGLFDSSPERPARFLDSTIADMGIQPGPQEFRVQVLINAVTRGATDEHWTI